MTTLRPLLFIAYGDAGGAWLRRLAAACARQPRLAPLAAARAVQFWWVGGRPPGSHPDALASVPPGVDPARLRTLLDAGRSARNRAAFGRLELHTVLVFERWSAFDEAAAHRIALRAALDTARRVDCDGARDAEFDFDWLSLVDCTRPSARPDDEALARARRLLARDALPDRVLLIDRVDAAGAMVDRDMADQCFLALALALGGSEHAFPRAGAADERRSMVLSGDPEPGAAVPIGVLALHHQLADIEHVVAARRRRELLSAPPRPPETAAAPSPPELDALPAREAEELAAGRFSPREARLRRNAAAEALLAAAFARRDGFLDALAAVERARGAARARLGPARAAGRGTARTDGGAPAATRETAGPPLIAPAPAAAAPLPLLRALWHRLRPRRSRARTAPATIRGPQPDRRAPDVARRKREPSAASPARELDAARADAARQWKDLCAALAAVLERWRDAAVAAERGTAAAGVWERVDGRPWEWRLAHHPAMPPAAADPNAYAALAAECLRLALDGAPPATLPDAAVREVVRRDLARSAAAAADVLRAALREPHAAPLRAAVRDATLLANAGRRIPVAEVLWLAAAEPGIADALARLEPVETRPRVRVVAHDDAGRSVRLAFGEPLRWSDVLSLSFLRAER